MIQTNTMSNIYTGAHGGVVATLIEDYDTTKITIEVEEETVHIKFKSKYKESIVNALQNMLDSKILDLEE